MGYSRREFVMAAYAELGFAASVFDLDPSDLELAMRRMDSMMATWNAQGIRVGYPLPTNPTDSDLDDATGVPDAANEAIITNLAIRLAPGLGKVVSQDTKVTAKLAFNALAAKSATPREMQLNQLPSGAGNKSHDNPFLSEPSETFGSDADLSFD